MQNEEEIKLIDKISELDYDLLLKRLHKDFRVNLADIIEKKDLFIKQKNLEKDIFLLNDLNHKLIKDLPEREIEYLGILLASILKNGKISYHFEILNLIAEKTIRKIIVNSKGEQTTLYGKNITKKMLQSSFFEFKKGQKVLVLNKYREVLGLGTSLFNYKDLKNLHEKKVIFKNMIDKGWYLRKGG
ncbi:MAG: hypothetical protein ACTSVY_08500 [Candidatus Helarchaeota archaeon]